MLKSKKSKKYSWEEARKEFVENRIIEVPISQFKQCKNASQLPYEPSNEKETKVIGAMIEDQTRTLLYSYERIMEKFGYVEKVGSLKFSNEQDAKEHIFGLVRSEATWKDGFSIVGNDNGMAGVPCDRFPFESDDFEDQFWDDGLIDAYSFHIDNLQNGEVLNRKIVWDALRAVFERNLAILKWRLCKGMIKNRIREI